MLPLKKKKVKEETRVETVTMKTLTKTIKRVVQMMKALTRIKTREVIVMMKALTRIKAKEVIVTTQLTTQVINQLVPLLTILELTRIMGTKAALMTKMITTLEQIMKQTTSWLD